MGLLSGGKSVNKPMGLIFGGAYLRKTPVLFLRLRDLFLRFELQLRVRFIEINLLFRAILFHLFVARFHKKILFPIIK